MQNLPVVFFKEDDGSVPFLRWLDHEVARRNAKIAIKCLARLRVLRDLGPKELTVEFTKPLRDGIWELRIEYQRVNYRILYFFSKERMIVVSHGCWKEAQVPPKEIDLAIERKVRFESDTMRYTYVWEEEND